jgi:hypothetical protein
MGAKGAPATIPSGANRTALPADKGGERVAPATNEAATSPAAPKLSAAAVREALDQMASFTRPSATAADAQAALQLMNRVLPQLDDPRDLVELQLRGAEAHLILDQPAQACRLLLAIERDAAASPRRANVAAYLADPELACRSR